MSRPLHITVNGRPVQVMAEAGEFLLDVLRRVGFTGAKEGCGEGECGACTVIMDGVAARPCLVFAHAASGSDIETVEGLADKGAPHPLQQSFEDHNAVQCGYCTPGLVMQAKALLDRNPDPSEQDVRFALAGNLCRCTGYRTIIAAVQDAAKRMRTSE